MFLVQLLIGIGLMILGYLLMPKPKQEKPEISELEGPTASAGRPVAVVFGDELVQELNILGWWDKGYEQRWKRNDGGKK